MVFTVKATNQWNITRILVHYYICKKIERITVKIFYKRYKTIQNILKESIVKSHSEISRPNSNMPRKADDIQC